MARDYVQELKALLPVGKAWNRSITSVFHDLITGLAAEFARVDLRAADLYQEMDPRFTTEMIDGWESDYGLPDTCAPIPVTIEERRALLNARVIAQSGDNGIQFLLDYLDSLGVDTINDVIVRKHKYPAFTCGSPCNAPLNSPDAGWPWVWELEIKHSSLDARVRCELARVALSILSVRLAFPLVLAHQASNVTRTGLAIYVDPANGKNHQLTHNQIGSSYVDGPNTEFVQLPTPGLGPTPEAMFSTSLVQLFRGSVASATATEVNTWTDLGTHASNQVTGSGATRPRQLTSGSLTYLDFDGTEFLERTSGLTGLGTSQGGQGFYAWAVCRFGAAASIMPLIEWTVAGGTSLKGFRLRKSGLNLAIFEVELKYGIGNVPHAIAANGVVGASDIFIEGWVETVAMPAGVSNRIGVDVNRSMKNVGNVQAGFTPVMGDSLVRCLVGKDFAGSPNFLTGRIYEMGVVSYFSHALRENVAEYVKSTYLPSLVI